MNQLLSKLRTFSPAERYWNTAFFVFFCAYLLPFGSGPSKTVFYLGILLPAFLFSTRRDYATLFTSRYFLVALILCCYAILRAAAPDSTLDTLKFIISLLALSLAALKLPAPSIDTTRRTASLFIIALLTYVLANAAHQALEQHWTPGSRLAPLFGNLKSVIFCADLMISALVVHSWCSITQRDYRALFLTNAIVITFVLWLLQSRSVIPIWIGSMAVLLACTIRSSDWRRALCYISALVCLVAILSSGALPALLERGDSYRFEIWSAYLLSTLGCGALFGCGWGVELPFVTGDNMDIAHPHSMYVQHFYWGGFIGLALLLITLAAPLITGIRRKIYAAWALLPGCIALLFDGKGLIAQPNERWFLLTVPFAILLAELARQANDKRHP